MRMRALAAVVLGLVATAAMAENAPDPVTIRGELTYRARIALPPAAIAVVELRDAAAPPEASAVAELRTALQAAIPRLWFGCVPRKPPLSLAI